MPDQSRHYSEPVTFVGVVGAIHPVEFDDGKATMAGMVVASDDTCKDHLIMAICPTKPKLKNGDWGLLVGYLGTRSIKVVGQEFIVVIARTILSADQAARYGLNR